MKFDFLKDKKCWCFAAGIATAVVGKKIATSDKVKETLQNMREEAEDMCYEAKSQLNDEEE